MLNIEIMADQPAYNIGRNGKIKAVNGVNGSPIPLAPGFPNLQKEFNEMEITDFRLHDTYGPLDIDNTYPAGRTASQFMDNVPESERKEAGQLMVDLGNMRTIFPNAALGMRQGDLSLVLKDANYEISDSYLRNLINNEEDNPKNIQRRVIFRIGRSMDGGFMIPENIEIYAELVANVVDRYTNNYARIGLKRKVTHWQVWNEPNYAIFWNETAKNFCRFYTKIANAVKRVDKDAKVGGSGITVFNTFKNDYIDYFFQYCRENNTPLDFFAWHLYNVPNPEIFVAVSDYIRNKLITYGYGQIESVLGEWNSSPVNGLNTFSKVQSAINATYVAAVFIQMQHSSIDKAYYYRGDGASFGLFNRAKNKKNSSEMAYCSYTAQTFKIFSMMLETPNIIRSSRIHSTGINILAARSDNKINILVANYRNNPDLYDPSVKPNGGYYEQYYVDSSKQLLQLNDEVNREIFFGGKDVTSLYNNNQVKEVPVQPVVDSHLSTTYKYYTDSEGGITISLFGVVDKIKSKTVYRIYEGGDLSQLEPEKIDTDGLITESNGTLIITDPNAVEYTITLYSIDLV